MPWSHSYWTRCCVRRSGGGSRKRLAPRLAGAPRPQHALAVPSASWRTHSLTSGGSIKCTDSSREAASVCYLWISTYIASLRAINRRFKRIHREKSHIHWRCWLSGEPSDCASTRLIPVWSHHFLCTISAQRGLISINKKYGIMQPARLAWRAGCLARKVGFAWRMTLWWAVLSESFVSNEACNDNVSASKATFYGTNMDQN